MRRINAIRNIMDTITDEIVISSCGKISRELYYVKDRPKNFYVQGSMGSTLPIGIGVSLAKPNKKVVVIIGDGEALMGLDTLVLLKKLQKRHKNEYVPFGDLQAANNIIIKNRFNLDLYILDNGKYASTGGQKTISNFVDFRLLCDCKVIFCGDSKIKVPRIDITHKEIKERFMNAI